MKSDLSRDTFDPLKHFSSVRMQQGRVQLDANDNEQSDIVAHRVETETRDVIGLCGGPMHNPAFHIVGALSHLSTEEQALSGNKVLPGNFTVPDFLISAGRYYVDGILCENEKLTSYLTQPDLLDAPPINQAGLYLVYLDVWQRLLTALDDPSIREIALGGPDTATREKTVWQVKYWLAMEDGKNIENGNCLATFREFDDLIAPSSGKLSARTKPAQVSTDPCIVPPGAGYTGLENQLYRIEIHDGGTALDATTAGTSAGRVAGKVNQIKVTGSWRVGQAVEIFSRQKSDDPMNGTLAYITNVASGGELETTRALRTTKTKTIVTETGGKILTLDLDVSKIALDELLVRPARATFKWSRDNGVVVTAIRSIDGEKVTVHDLGPDDALGFNIGQWVEISDDALELNGLPGQLALIIDVDSAINLIELNIAPTLIPDQTRHPKLRRWDGVGAVKSVAGDHFLDLESGVQVRFSGQGSVRTGDYWTIAARTATADTQSGNIEWPRDAAGEPLEQLPFGIKHHYCRLAMLHVAITPGLEQFATAKTALTGQENIGHIGIHPPTTNFDRIEDCRHLFPPITELTNLFFVSGDGQEAMPNDPLPQLLRTSVFNGSAPVAGARVRFKAEGSGRLAPTIAGLTASSTNTLTVVTGADGIASCAWKLEPDVSKPSQHVEARLLDTDLQPTPATVGFNGNLSIADQVAYDPGVCQPLLEDRTVQKALDRLSHLISLYEVSGNNQEIEPGDVETLQPLVVLAANRCGPVTDPATKVRFKVISGSGKVNGQNQIDVPVEANGQASCDWTPDPKMGNQEVEASFQSDSLHPSAPPTTVRFTCKINFRSCETTVGPGGRFERLDVALTQLLEEHMDVCICLLPGQHILPSGFRIKTIKQGSGKARVKIAGCGWGSVIRLSLNQPPTNQPATNQLETTQTAKIQGGSTVQAGPIQLGVRATDLGSFILTDVDVLAETSLVFEGCEEVTFAGCHLVKTNEIAPFITIAGANRIRFEGNMVEASPLVTATGISGGVLAGTVLSDLPQTTDPVAFNSKASEIATNLAGLPTGERKTLAKKLQKSLGGIDNLTPEQVTSFNNLTESLAAKEVDASQLQGNLAVFGLPLLPPPLGVAIVIVNAADTWIEDNVIDGIVSLYGAPGDPRLTIEQLKLVSRAWTLNALLLRGVAKSLHVRNNVISRMTVSDETFAELRLPTTLGIHAGPPPPNKLTELYSRGLITNNVFRSGNNDFVMEHLALTSNSFELWNEATVVPGSAVMIRAADAGIVVADAAIYMGNYAPDDIRLFNVARTSEKAANLMINIANP